MSKKTIFFLPTLGGGGAERTVIQLANSFVEQGIYTEIIVCNTQGEKGKLLAEIHPNINLLDLNCGRVAHAILPLARLLKQRNDDVLIATQTHSNIVCAIAKKIARSNTQLIFREVSTSSQNIKLTGMKKNILKTMVRCTYPMAKQVVCVSKGVQQDFIEYYAYSHSNLTTIYNPVIDASYFKKLEATVSHRFFSADYKVILAIGRLTEAKNFNFLIRSFHQLYQQHTNVRLIILGEGELRTELETLVQDLGMTDVVDLAGFDLNPYAYFKYVDLFVLSSNWEGLPGVLIQALASKVKIVSTNCPSGPMEILSNAKFGLLVECNDVDGMSQAMQQAIFADYVSYDAEEFTVHCQQFYKANVLQRYLQLLESSAHD